MKWNRKILKNNLDEMQEQKLLHIEANGFWLFYGLIAADLIIKSLTNRAPKENVMEFVCFMAISFYLVAMCIKNGIWDRHLQANARTNVVVSLIGGVIVAGINLGVYVKECDGNFKWGMAAGVAGFSALFTMLITLLLLCIGTAFYQRRVRVLEEEEESEDEE